MFFVFAFSVDQNVIEVHYYKNVELFCQDLVDITLKHGWYIVQSKRHDLVFQVAMVGPENRLLFVFFPHPHLMVGINQFQLGKLSSPIESTQ